MSLTDQFPAAPSVTLSSPSPYPLRRSSRSTRGTIQSTKYVDELFLATMSPECNPASTYSTLTYVAELETDFDNGEVTCTDPRVYTANFKTYDDENPSYSMAMSGKDMDQWKTAILGEVRGLIKKNTWNNLPIISVLHGKKILLGTWEFKLKRFPDGSPSTFKAKYCVQGEN